MEMKKNLVEKSILVLLLISLFILVIIMAQSVNELQESLRVVSFAGSVRGDTQRLVKLEITENQNDLIITKLDTILSDLINGGGENDLIKLEDPKYQETVYIQESLWSELKTEINTTRSVGAEQSNLLETSEEYDQAAGDTIEAAENYSEQLSEKLQQVKIGLLINILLIVLVLFYQLFLTFTLIKNNHNLKVLSCHDAQTGLFNKGYCDHYLYEQGIITKDRNFACVMFDLNNLKKINDSKGHQEGDRMIKCFAEVLKKSGPDSTLMGRFGGDEFIAVFKDSNEAEMRSFISKIDDNISALSALEGEVDLSYAVGYEFSSLYDKCTLQLLMDKADQKMYLDKIKKKNSRS
ncbi:GGDEF domain-containing protein [Eubacteriaceae bacterium ES2]|nr:GGDEF domain-containing protein [Eubacteriaceae bacterium ES2]